MMAEEPKNNCDFGNLSSNTFDYSYDAGYVDLKKVLHLN
jgi:hypothetical protein